MAIPAYFYFTAVGIALAAIDIHHRRLHAGIVSPSYLVLVVLLTFLAAARQEWWALKRALAGGVVLFLVYLVITLVHPQGMGFGDVRLSRAVPRQLDRLTHLLRRREVRLGGQVTEVATPCVTAGTAFATDAGAQTPAGTHIRGPGM